MKLNRIKIVLAEVEVRQNALSEHLGYTTATVYRWCKNESQPYLSDLKRVADFLNVPIRDLIVNYKPNQD